MSYVRIEKPRPHTRVIVMDRPERMNSMAFELVVPLHEAIKEVGATGLKDMGRAMAALKARYAGRMDFAKASTLVKKKLA